MRCRLLPWLPAGGCLSAGRVSWRCWRRLRRRPAAASLRWCWSRGRAGAASRALLARFASGLAGAAVLRAGGDEAELLLPYGIVGQLVASARGAGGGPPGLLAAELSDRVDPLAVGADLVVWLGQVCRGRGMVLAVIDDLQWADGPSARALLFARAPAAGRPGAGGGVGPAWGAVPAGRGLAAFPGRGPPGRPGLPGRPGAARMWWRWAGRWGSGSCRAAPSAVCWRRPAVTRCTAVRCWKRPGPGPDRPAGRWGCRGRWPGWCWRGWAR